MDVGCEDGVTPPARASRRLALRLARRRHRRRAPLGRTREAERRLFGRVEPAKVNLSATSVHVRLSHAHARVGRITSETDGATSVGGVWPRGRARPCCVNCFWRCVVSELPRRDGVTRARGGGQAAHSQPLWARRLALNLPLS
jgi:hypothetical protein